MGYTHYYSVSRKFDPKAFAKVLDDFLKMLPVLERLGVKLAGPSGSGKPILTPEEISFNGDAHCGHTERELGITWPSKRAKGVADNKVDLELQQISKSSWIGGAELESRICGGDCSHEAFRLEQHLEPGEIPAHKKNDKLIFSFTKTAYKPYDLAVNICLIIAKHHLKNNIEVSSDGGESNWIEGKTLCQHFLGYGNDFKLDE